MPSECSYFLPGDGTEWLRTSKDEWAGWIPGEEGCWIRSHAELVKTYGQMDPDGYSWFKQHEDAVAQADRRAAITGYRYRVYFDSANRWWNIRETTTKIRKI